MILIVSDDSEHSTDRVIDWLIYFGSEFLRVSLNDKIDINSINISNEGPSDCSMVIESKITDTCKVIDISKIKSFWFRRSNLEITNYANSGFDESVNFIINYLARETFTIKDYIHNKLKDRNHINSLKDIFTNKLNNLELAKKNGLVIPDTLITSSKLELLKFYNDHNCNIIYKSLDFGYLRDKKRGIEINLYTQRVDFDDFKNNCENFYPTFFQENIEKEFEIRVFYLKGKCYSTAIFSQNDERTKLDFRHYNILKPNRTPKITLPKKIENQIKSFMHSAGLNSGSLDLIYSKDKKFVFLEVNPVGQYEQVSTPGNFFLDKLIAETLIN